MFKLKQIFKIKILYKSGATHEIWVEAFKVKDGVYSWKEVDPKNQIIVIGVDEIAAVFQVGIKYKFF